MSVLNTSSVVGVPNAEHVDADGGDRALIAAFERLGPAYMRWVRGQSRPEAAGVSVARMRTLGLLRALGAKPMGFLAKESGIAPRTLTALVDGLERDGLAQRTPHPTDRRATLIQLTEQGERTLRACMKPHRAAVAALFGEFAETDRRELARLIPLLVAAIEAQTVRKS